MKTSPLQAGHIINAAIILFQKNGYNGTEIVDRANEANISVDEINVYYENKEIIFKDVFIELYSRIAPQLDDILNGEMPILRK